MNNHFMKRGRNQRRRQGGGPNPNRALDSNGPDVRIRGTAQQIYDKYLALARDAQSSGDRVKAENYLQHAEHYFRVLRSVQGSAPASSFDQNSQDGDSEGEQSGLAGDRDQRFERPQQASYGGDDAGGGDPSAEEQPDIAAYSDDRDQDQRPQDNGGRPQGGQSAGQQSRENGGDNESRRRRRRPRRPREDGAPSDGQASDQDVEPAAV